MTIRAALPNPKKNESMFIFSRPYFLAFLPWFSIGFLLTLIGIILTVFIGNNFSELLAEPLAHNIFVIFTSAYFLLIVPFLTVAFIDFYFDLLIVTDRRLIDIDQNKLFSRSINELALEQIEDVSATTNKILSTVFDYGDVLIETAGTQQNFFFQNIRHPREVTSVILDLADQAKRRLERGDDPIHLEPLGRTKGVIENQIFTEVEPLVSLGAVISPNPKPVESPTLSEEKSVDPAPPNKPTPPPPTDTDLDIVIDDPSDKK